MSRSPTFLRVARWEFLRFYKTKELLWGTVIILAVFLGQKIVSERITGETARPRTVVVLGGELLPRGADRHERFRFERSDRAESDLAEAVREKEYDGLLVFTHPDSARLIVRRPALWQDDLGSLLASVSRSRRLEESGLAAETLALIAAPFGLRTESLEVGRTGATHSRWSVGILVGLMLTGILIGNSYLFIAITGEKTQRITEQIMSAISPQSWVDGKILGLAALALVHLWSYLLGYFLYRVACAVIWKEGLGLPPLLSDPSLFATSLVLILLGFYFWFCFFGLVAATISDPNNSSRSSLLMLPFFPLGAAFAGLKHPDALWMKLLGVLPFSSPSVMPARLVLGEVAWWEFPLAVALLALGIWVLRRAAGIVFGLGMLMYGKEPGAREIWRWLREGWGSSDAGH